MLSGRTSARTLCPINPVSYWEVRATAGVHCDTVCTQTHTHAQIFYIGCKKQLLSDRKPAGHHVLQHTLSVDNETSSQQPTETSFKLQPEIKVQ